MTGVGGRPEVVIEGHATDRSADSGWKSFEFLYKPGDLSLSPPIVGKYCTVKTFVPFI